LDQEEYIDRTKKNQNKQMKKFLSVLAGLLFTAVSAFSQTCPPTPGTGTYVIFDTTYTAGTVNSGETHVKMCFKNSTSTKISGVQFRVWYDKNAFGSAAPVVTSLNTSFPQSLQYVTNTTEGNITITLVYTGNSTTFTIPEGQLFDLKLSHSANFWTYTSISNMAITGTTAFVNGASDIAGMDATLTLHNYGGIISPIALKYKGKFLNVTGTPAKNLTLSLQRKPKTGGVWTDVSVTSTDLDGKFIFNQAVDTTYYDARLYVKGDTLGFGNIITTADAQKVNDIVLGTATPLGFDYYASDVNGSGNITIADVYSVFGRISGNLSSWPNNVKDVKFFSESEYNTINGASTNYTSTISGTTILTFNILPNQPDSVTFYVLGMGDVNGTGYHMARMVPVQIVNPNNSLNYIIDKNIEFDNNNPTIELNLPRLNDVQTGNLVNVPVKYLSTTGDQIASMQFGVWYDQSLLEFKGIEQTSSVAKWITYLNPENNVVDWGGYDPSGRQNMLKNGDVAFTLKFLALEPKTNWTSSPLWVTRKAAGGPASQDYGIKPTEGFLQLRMSSGATIISPNTLLVYPNPTDGPVTFSFSLTQGTRASLGVYDINGRKQIDVITENFPQGKYSYTVDLGTLSTGTYVVGLLTDSNLKMTAQKLVKQ
jgi:hypothetical protein